MSGNNLQPQEKPLSSEQEQLDAAHEKLVSVIARLKAAQKILRRDWPNLTPRQRSGMSRNVRELEREYTSLQEEVEMLGPL